LKEDETAAHQPDGGHLPMSAITLRDGGDAIIEALLEEIRTRIEPIGVSVVEARISPIRPRSREPSCASRPPARWSRPATWL
jgi:hypothetical protein